MNKYFSSLCMMFALNSFVSISSASSIPSNLPAADPVVSQLNGVISSFQNNLNGLGSANVFQQVQGLVSATNTAKETLTTSQSVLLSNLLALQNSQAYAAALQKSMQEELNNFQTMMQSTGTK